MPRLHFVASLLTALMLSSCATPTSVELTPEQFSSNSKTRGTTVTGPKLEGTYRVLRNYPYQIWLRGRGGEETCSLHFRIKRTPLSGSKFYCGASDLQAPPEPMRKRNAWSDAVIEVERSDIRGRMTTGFHLEYYDSEYPTRLEIPAWYIGLFLDELVAPDKLAAEKAEEARLAKLAEEEAARRKQEEEEARRQEERRQFVEAIAREAKLRREEEAQRVAAAKAKHEKRYAEDPAYREKYDVQQKWKAASGVLKGLAESADRLYWSSLRNGGFNASQLGFTEQFNSQLAAIKQLAGEFKRMTREADLMASDDTTMPVMMRITGRWADEIFDDAIATSEFLDQCAAAQQNAAVANTRLHDVLANARLTVGFYTEGVPLKHPDSKDESRYLIDLEYKEDFDLKSRWFATARELSALHEKTESILKKYELGGIVAIQRGFSEEFSKTMSSLRSTNAWLKQLRHAAKYVAMSSSPYLRDLATLFLSEQVGGLQKLEDLTHKFAEGTPTILHEMVNSDEASLMIYAGK